MAIKKQITCTEKAEVNSETGTTDDKVNVVNYTHPFVQNRMTGIRRHTRPFNLIFTLLRPITPSGAKVTDIFPPGAILGPPFPPLQRNQFGLIPWQILLTRTKQNKRNKQLPFQL